MAEIHRIPNADPLRLHASRDQRVDFHIDIGMTVKFVDGCQGLVIRKVLGRKDTNPVEVASVKLTNGEWRALWRPLARKH